MEKSIQLRECLDWMDAGLVFSFSVRQYDERRTRINGKVLKYQEAVLLKADAYESGQTPEKKTGDGVKRKPNHGQFFTRNVRPCIGGVPIAKIVKIHPDLLMRFNGRKVILP